MNDFNDDLTAFLENPNGFFESNSETPKSNKSEKSTASNAHQTAAQNTIDEKSGMELQPSNDSTDANQVIDNSMANEQTAFTMPEVSEKETESFKEQNKAIEEIFIKQKLSKLKETKPEFQYGNIIKEIPNTEITFEQLRIEMQNEIVALEQSKKVSWTVKYGCVTEAIANPTTQRIIDVKEKIEGMDKFINSIINGKKKENKDPKCVITPYITAEKKGNVLSFPKYKGFYTNLSEAAQSDKPIKLIPSSTGKIMQITHNKIGEFCTPVLRAPEFDLIKPGIKLSLPKIPFNLILEVIEFFRYFAEKGLEAIAHIIYSEHTAQYEIYIPNQIVSCLNVETYDLPDFGSSGFIDVMAIHSHHNMKAFFSDEDDADEKETKLYGVIGRLDKALPDMIVRMCNNGYHYEIEPFSVIEQPAFPKEDKLLKVKVKKEKSEIAL